MVKVFEQDKEILVSKNKNRKLRERIIYFLLSYQVARESVYYQFNKMKPYNALILILKNSNFSTK